METLLSYVLPSILGDFILGIDKNHMKTNLFAGEARLTGVSLNPAILKSTNLPLKILYSHVGELRIIFPWRQGMKKPTEIYLHDLFLVLEQDPSFDDVDIIADRIKFLDDLLKEIRNKLKELGDKTEKKESSLDYYKILILDNLQVSIKNIHVRFENSKKGYAFGLTLDEIKMLTVNENGQPEFLDRTLSENKMRDLNKKLMINGISLYWNAKEEKANLIGNSAMSLEDKKKFLERTIIREGNNQAASAQPILSLSLESLLVLKNANKERKENEPSYRLEVDLKPIEIKADNEQVNQMVSMLNFITKNQKDRRKAMKIPQLPAEEELNEIILYKKTLTDFLLSIEEKEFSWKDELENPKRSQFADQLKGSLKKLSNKQLAQASREVIIKDEKRRTVQKIEKQSESKGFFGFWKSSDSAEKKDEEIQKIESYFESFAQENKSLIDSNLMKGFIFETNVRLNEISVFCLDKISQEKDGLFAALTNVQLKVQLRKDQEFDIGTVEFVISDGRISLQERELNGAVRKERVVLTKYNLQLQEDLANLKLQTKSSSKGGMTFDLKGRLRGTEFTYFPELVNGAKNFLKRDQNLEEVDNAIDLAIEKMADLSKNAQDQLKSILDEYSSAFSIDLKWDLFHAIVPMKPKESQTSDGWVFAINGFEIKTDDVKSDHIGDKIKLQLSNINVEYFEQLTGYYERKTVQQDIQKPSFPLMEDTEVLIELLVSKAKAGQLKDYPKIALNLTVGDIGVNMNPTYYKKILELQNCFDFPQKVQPNALENIVRDDKNVFRVYLQENRILNTWAEYTMKCIGFRLDFYKNPQDADPVKSVITKNTEIKIDDETYDFPNILKLKNQIEETYLAFVSDKDLLRLVETMQVMNKEYSEESLEISVKLEDLDSVIYVKGSEDEQKKEEQKDDIMFQLNVIFEGLHVSLFEQFDKKLNLVSVCKLVVQVNAKNLYQTLKIQLAAISVLDYTINSDQNNAAIQLLSSQSQEDKSEIPAQVNDLITIEGKFFESNHPDFKRNLNEKEVSVIFNSLSVNYVPERIYFLMNFFTKPIEELAQSSVDDCKRQQDIPNQNSDIQFIARKSEIREVKLVVSSIQVNELSLTLYTQISHIQLARATLKHLSTEVGVDKNGLSAKGSLQNLQLFDLTNHQQDPSITEVVPYELVGIDKGLSILEFNFVKRSEAYMKQLNSDDENFIDLTINSIKVNYINQPFLRIAEYFTNFITDFAFAQNRGEEEIFKLATETITRHKSNVINVTLNHPKIFLKAKPFSEVIFDLEVESVKVSNRVSVNTDRVLKKTPSFQSVYAETYKIQVSNIVLNKRLGEEGKRIWLSHPFSLSMEFERCMWDKEYLCAYQISQADKATTLDYGYYLKGSSTPIFMKFDQEDYLDIMDIVEENLAFEDQKDALYHIQLENSQIVQAAEKDENPLNVNITFDYIAALVIDQIVKAPLSKMVAMSTSIEFTKSRLNEKVVAINIPKLFANCYEKQHDQEDHYLEKTLVGHSYHEREVCIPTIVDVGELFNPEVIEKEKKNLENDGDTLVKINYKMEANQDKSLFLHIKQLRVISNLKILMRLKDFAIFETDVGAKREELSNEQTYKFKARYQGVIDSFEISVPNTENTAIVLKSCVQFDYLKYDIKDILQKKKEFFDSAQMNFCLHKSEIFVFHEEGQDDSKTVHKRSIILPFSMTYQTKESLTYEATNNKLLAKIFNFCLLEKIVLKVSSFDSMVLVSVLMGLEHEYSKYKELPVFNQFTKEALLKAKEINADLTTLNQSSILTETHQLEHDGIQMRVINDLSGISIPLFDFCLHANANSSAIVFTRNLMQLLNGKNTFQISSSFFNAKIGKWEPIIEKWQFNLDTEFEDVDIPKKIITLANNNQEPLNINVSDEMVKVLLEAWRDWNDNFQQFKETNKLSFSAIKSSAGCITKMSQMFAKKEMVDAERISPFTIWNDSGYPLHIEPYLMGTHKNGISCSKEVHIGPGGKEDLIMNWSVERIFEASTKQEILEGLKITIYLEHPEYGMLEIPDIDVQNLGSKRRLIAITQTKMAFPLICNVFVHKKKKIVQFSSPIRIKNSLPKDILIEVHTKKSESPFMLFIDHGAESALPFDMALKQNSISFHCDTPLGEDGRFPMFLIESIIQKAPPGVRIGNNYAILRTEPHLNLMTIHLEPLITIKNCLPTPFLLAIAKKEIKELQPQEEIQICEHGPEFRLTMQLKIGEFFTNEYTIIPNEERTKQQLFLQHHQGLIPLVAQHVGSHTGAFKLLIAAKTVIVNESQESLRFIGCYPQSVVVSHFHVPTSNGNEIIYFNDAPGLKVQPIANGSLASELIPLDKPENFPLVVRLNQKESKNLGIRITNVLCDKQTNLFTKVVSVCPRYIIVNQSDSILSFSQEDVASPNIVLIPGERQVIHFPQGRLLRITPTAGDNEPAWNKSGRIDISNPGSFSFVCHNEPQTRRRYFNITVTLQDATLYISVQEQKATETPIQLKNALADFEMIVSQKGVQGTKTAVSPLTTSPFSWEEPNLENVLTIKFSCTGSSSEEFPYLIPGINQVQVNAIKIAGSTVPIYSIVSLSGKSRVIEFSFIPEFETQKKKKETEIIFRLSLPSLGISLISTAHRQKCELVYFSFTPVQFVLADKGDQTSVQLRIHSIMVDTNYQHNTQFPVAIFAQNIKRLQENKLPHLDFVCKFKNDSEIPHFHDVVFYLANTCICLDGFTVNAISDFVRSINGVLRKTVYSQVKYIEYLFLSQKQQKNLYKAATDRKAVCLSWRNFDPSASKSEFIYMEKIVIHPIMLSLTFKNPQFEFDGGFVFAYIKTALGKVFGNLDNVPIDLSGIRLTNVYCLQDQMVGGLADRYKQISLNSILKVVFSANIIGNPISFFTRVSSGVNDLIEKPTKGFLEGPLEGGFGVIEGVGSLAVKTVGATFNSLHNITDSLASGITSLSGDKKFIEKREQANAKQNTNIGSGAIKAATSIGKGFFSGITGVVEKPLEGAKKGGFGGFLKGAYVGTKGLVLKPVAGVLDGVSKLTEGVSNTIDTDAKYLTKRSRIPRLFYGKERIYQSYHPEHVKLFNFIQQKKPKRYANLTLLVILPVSIPPCPSQDVSHCLILTFERVFLVALENAAIAWKFKSQNIFNIICSDSKIEVFLKKPTKSKKQSELHLPCQNDAKLVEIFTTLTLLKDIIEDVS